MDGEPVRILLVEDNAADVYLFRKALESAELEFELTVIEDGAEALAFVQDEGKFAGRLIPDLAVLDLNLPKNDGSQVLQAMRQSERFFAVPVVITSSSPSPPTLTATALADVARYLRKPPDLEDFLQIGTVLKEVLLESKARQSSTRPR